MAPGKRKFLLSLLSLLSLSKKLVCIVLIAAAVAGRFPARPAEAVITDKIVIAALEVAIKKAMERLESATEEGLIGAGQTFLYEVMLLVEQELRHGLEKKLYDLDHLPLVRNAVQGDLGEFLHRVYDTARFTPDNDPFYRAEANFGYRGRSGSTRGRTWRVYDFSQVYVNRTSVMSDQGKAKLRANSALALSATDPGNPAGISVIQSVHEPLMNSGEYLQRGYRELAQAESQAHTMSNKQASMLRTAATTRSDALIRHAVNRRQEKHDRVAAFDIAVYPSWKQPETPPAY